MVKGGELHQSLVAAFDLEDDLDIPVRGILFEADSRNGEGRGRTGFGAGWRIAIGYTRLISILLATTQKERPP